MTRFMKVSWCILSLFVGLTSKKVDFSAINTPIDTKLQLQEAWRNGKKDA